MTRGWSKSPTLSSSSINSTSVSMKSVFACMRPRNNGGTNLRRRDKKPGEAHRSPGNKLLAGCGKTEPAFHPPDLLPPLRSLPADLGLAFRGEAHRAAHLHRTCGAPHTCPGGRCQGVQVSRGRSEEARGGFFRS